MYIFIFGVLVIAYKRNRILGQDFINKNFIALKKTFTSAISLFHRLSITNHNQRKKYLCI